MTPPSSGIVTFVKGIWSLPSVLMSHRSPSADVCVSNLHAHTPFFVQFISHCSVVGRDLARRFDSLRLVVASGLPTDGMNDMYVVQQTWRVVAGTQRTRASVREGSGCRKLEQIRSEDCSCAGAAKHPKL